MIDRPLTEAELVLSTLTNEELDDAARYMGHMLEQWLASRRSTEYSGRDELLDAGYHGTEGPVHAIQALDLAIVRERAIRRGAEPWDARQSADGHPARTALLFYRERLEWNPDLGRMARLNAAGALEKVCRSCGEAKPLTVAFWRWMGSMLDHSCRGCRVAGEQEASDTLRAAIVGDQDARAAARPAEPVEDLGGWAP